VPPPTSAAVASNADAAERGRMPPAVTAPIAERDRKLLERRVARWAEGFAALGEWQPVTTWTDRGVDYAAALAREPAADSMGIEEAVVTVTTERDGRQWSTQVRMRRLAFSHFAQLIDRWDPDVQIHDDEIDGRFHSNSEIIVSRSNGVQPMFHGKVTTARGVDTSRSTHRVRQSEVFLGGLQTRAPHIRLPRGAPPFDSDRDDRDEIDEDRIHELDADTRIVFYANGSYGWTDPERTLPEQRRRLTSEPHYLVAGEDAELLLSGVVNGKVLVYSPEDIVIAGNLVYAEAPALVPDSDDFLGLVSEKSVEIAEPEITGTGDVSVHAAIYAKRRFAVRRYSARDDATLEVFGSVTAGSLTATEPRFRTKLRFDPRLEHRRPPRFPVTDRYEIVDWDGLWTAELP
jgi:hypothetical protein